MVRVFLLFAFGVAVVALVIYGLVWLYQTHTKKEVTETKLEHERRLAREERDYDTLIADLADDAERMLDDDRD